MKVIGLYKELMNSVLTDALFIDQYVLCDINVEDFNKGTMTPFDYSSYMEAAPFLSQCHKPKFKSYADDGLSSEKINIPALKAAKAIELQRMILIKKLNVDCDSKVSALSGTKYGDMERATWSKQEAEASNYIIDNTSLTPFIDSIVAARDIDKETLINKIIANVTDYDNQSATIIGTTQQLIINVNGCTTIGEMAALNLPVGLDIFKKLEPA